MGEVPLLFPPFVCFDVLLSVQFSLCQEQLAWVVYTHACAQTQALLLILSLWYMSVVGKGLAGLFMF